MRTFISDIIPKIKRYSEDLDNLTLLMNHHWVVIDEIENSKNVYIFRSNNLLLIAQNGKVEKANWEYLGNNSLLIDRNNESYLFKQGFFDEQILALKVDSKDEYAILVNENKFGEEINSADKVSVFLKEKYSAARTVNTSPDDPYKLPEPKLVSYSTNKGNVQIEKVFSDQHVKEGMRVFKNGSLAPSGKYKLDIMWYIHINNGVIEKVSLF